MAFELKNGQGSMFENLKKTKESQPDFRGDFKDLNGKILQIAGWKKKTKDGKKFISLTIQEKQEKGSVPPQANPDAW